MKSRNDHEVLLVAFFILVKAQFYGFLDMHRKTLPEKFSKTMAFKFYSQCFKPLQQNRTMCYSYSRSWAAHRLGWSCLWCLVRNCKPEGNITYLKSNLLIKFSPIWLYRTLDHVLFSVDEFLYVRADEPLPWVSHNCEQETLFIISFARELLLLEFIV